MGDAPTLKELYAQWDRLYDQYFAIPWEQESDGDAPSVAQIVAITSQMDELRPQIRARERDFEADLRGAFAAQMRDDHGLAVQVYGALCNVDWEHENGTRYSASWRYAGGLVNEIVNPDDKDPMGYCNFYCSGGEGHVRSEIAEGMAARGWSFKSVGQ